MHPVAGRFSTAESDFQMGLVGEACLPSSGRIEDVFLFTSFSENDYRFLYFFHSFRTKPISTANVILILKCP